MSLYQLALFKSNASVYLPSVNPCRVCIHPHRTEIDVALLARTPLRKVAAEYALKLSSVANHAKHHVRQPAQAFGSGSIQPEQELDQPEQLQSASLYVPVASGNGKPLPWERQPRESNQAWSAWLERRRLGLEGNNHDVAHAVGKSVSMIKRWSHTWNWSARLEAWLREVDRVEQLRLKRETFEARERWRDTGRTMQDLGTKRISAIDPQKLPVDEARRFVIDGSQLESRGLGLDRTAMQVNQTTANITIDPRALENATRILIERRQRILLEQKKEEEACTILPVIDPT